MANRRSVDDGRAGVIEMNRAVGGGWIQAGGRSRERLPTRQPGKAGYAVTGKAGLMAQNGVERQTLICLQLRLCLKPRDFM